MIEGSVERWTSWSGDRPSHFQTRMSRWRSSQASSIVRSSAMRGGLGGCVVPVAESAESVTDGDPTGESPTMSRTYSLVGADSPGVAEDSGKKSRRMCNDSMGGDDVGSVPVLSGPPSGQHRHRYV